MSDYEMRDRIASLELDLFAYKRKLELALEANEELRSEVGALKFALHTERQERSDEAERRGMVG